MSAEKKEYHREYCRAWRKKNPNYSKLYKKANKEKLKAWNKEDYKKNGWKYRLNAKLKVYNMTKDKYFQLLHEQNCKCAICRKKIGKGKLHIDHCHKTNIVRGLLCQKCNLGLGQFNDNQSNLNHAIEYLNKNGRSI